MKILQIGNGNIGRMMKKIFNTEIIKISIRSISDIHNNLNEHINSCIILLCNKMKTEENYELFKQIINYLIINDFSGKIVNFGSTTEFYPLPFKVKYGNIKKKSLEILANSLNRKYKLIHIICPGKNIINKNKLKYHILKGVESVDDYYASISYEIVLTDNNYNKSILDNNYNFLTLLYSLNKTLLNNYLNTAFIYDNNKYFKSPTKSKLEIAKKMYKENGITILNVQLINDLNLDNINKFQINSNYGIMASAELFDIIKYILDENIIYPVTKPNGRGSWFIRSSNKTPTGHKHVDMRYIKNIYNRIIYYHKYTENCDYTISYWNSGKKYTVKPQKYDLMIIKQGTLHQVNKMSEGCRIIQLMDITSEKTVLNFSKWIHDKFVHSLKNNFSIYSYLF